LPKSFFGVYLGAGAAVAEYAGGEAVSSAVFMLLLVVLDGRIIVVDSWEVEVVEGVEVSSVVCVL
jgi:hypothetical protein